MATTMLGLLGVFLFNLAATAQLKPLADFNVKKVEGKWYLSGVATNAEWFKSNKEKVMVSAIILTPTADGDLHTNCSIMMHENSKNTSCIKVHSFLKRTKSPGRFLFYSPYFQAMNDLTIVDVEYNEYIIAQRYVMNKRSRKKNVFPANKLYTRNPKVSPEIRKKFIQFSLKQHTAPQNIIILPYQGECK